VSIDKFRKGVISGMGYISLVEMGFSDGNSCGNSEEVVAAVLQMLADARRKKGLTQENLSELSGVDHGVISRAERGLRTPSMAAIRDLAVALDFDFGKLVRKAEDRVRKNPG
jgi:ribosome-binding protein aMBF1 (putative translation factor)